MRPLNASEINRRVGVFAINFTILFVGSLACVYTYFNVAESEGGLLVQKANKYDQLVVKYQLLSDQVESIYTHMQLLNTEKVMNGLELQRLISNEKEKLNKTMLSGVGDTAVNFIAYKNLSKKINNLLSIKDSIRLVSIDEEALRTDLISCIAEDQQLRKKQKAGTPVDEPPAE
ncbi:MAG: type VI secretion system TssO [Sphingobacteriaceae bacterium]|jgi:hypothetical protein|nr:MAG: hypothetical protein E6Q66_01365 [Pedobacter sp.]